MELFNEDDDWYIRSKVVEALGKISDIRAVDVIKIALDDDILFVRQKAEEALERITLAESFKIIHFDDGEILFAYPINWDMKSVTEEKKIVKGVMGRK